MAVEYLGFLSAVKSGNADLAEKAFAKLCVLLAQFEASASRLDAVAKRCQKDMTYYAKIQSDVDAQITEAKDDIDRLKRELEAERLKRQQRVQYEAEAAVVNKHPSRDQLCAQIAAVEAELSAAEADGAALDSRIDLRKAQFGLVMSAIHDLQRLFDDEANEEKARVAAAAAFEASEKARRAAEAAAAAGSAAVDEDDEGAHVHAREAEDAGAGPSEASAADGAGDEEGMDSENDADGGGGAGSAAAAGDAGHEQADDAMDGTDAEAGGTQTDAEGGADGTSEGQGAAAASDGNGQLQPQQADDAMADVDEDDGEVEQSDPATSASLR